jgi:diguanylate cyclase
MLDTTMETLCQEAQRLEALLRYDIMDTPPESGFDRITRMAVTVFGASISTICLVDANRVWFKSRQGITHREKPRAHYFAQKIIEHGDVLTLEGMNETDRFRDRPFVSSPPGLRFFAGAPLLTPDKQIIGAFCIADAKARTLCPTDKTLLAEFAAIVMAEFEGRRLDRLLRHERDMSHRTALRLTEATHFDPVTGVANRASFNETLRAVIQDAAEQPVNLYIADIDMFRDVNNTFGEEMANMVLGTIARRMKSLAGPKDTVARIGNDEFALIQPHLDQGETLETMADRLQARLEDSIRIGDRDITLGISLGVARHPGAVDDGAIAVAADSAEALIRRANTALARRKHQRAGGAHIIREDEAIGFHPSRLELRSRLSDAIRFNEFELHYQPIVSIDESRPVGAEALLRWNIDEGNMAIPANFIALAEATGQIVEIGDWVLNEACMQAAEWTKRFGRPLKIAVNVSPIQFESGNFVATVKDALRHTQLAPSQLELELTENAGIIDSPSVRAALYELHALGIGVVIDDFGTGYASFRYLKEFPVTKLKIDRSFVATMLDDARNLALVRTMVQVAKGQNIDIVAEGVESELQWQTLRGEGCTYAQGYFFSRPVEPYAFEPLLA